MPGDEYLYSGKTLPKPSSYSKLMRWRIRQGQVWRQGAIGVSNSRNAIQRNIRFGRHAYAGYLRSFNEGTRVGIANSGGLTRKSLTAR